MLLSILILPTLKFYIAVVIPGGSHSVTGCEQVDKNFYDLNDINVMEGVASWRACSDLCRQDKQCGFWSWGASDNPKPKNRNRCLLKEKMSQDKDPSDFSGYISGTRNCGRIDGAWGEWKISECSKSCGVGVKTKTRDCNNPLPSSGGLLCPLSGGSSVRDAREVTTIICNNKACIVKKRELPKVVEHSRAAISSGTGFYIECKTMEKFSIKDLQSCSQRCMKNGNCRSFAYSLSTNRCYLSGEVKRDIRCSVVEEDDWVYFEVS